jgi:hypothetical protein
MGPRHKAGEDGLFWSDARPCSISGRCVVLERALAVEKAQAAMIRRMPEMMDAMSDIMSVDLEDEDLATAALAAEAKSGVGGEAGESPRTPHARS